MNQMLANFQSNQRQRERSKQKYIKELKEQIEEQTKRKSKENIKRKIEEEEFENKVMRQRESIRREGRERKAVSNIEIRKEEKRYQTNPEIESKERNKLDQSNIYSTYRYQSSILMKQYPILPFCHPKLSISSHLPYLRAKQNLHQQKQKISKLRNQIRYLSYKPFKHKIHNPLQSLKHLTVSIHKQCQNMILSRKRKMYSKRQNYSMIQNKY